MAHSFGFAVAHSFGLACEAQESLIPQMGDISYGAFLSAGLESSLKVALRTELADRPVSQFSVAIENDARSDGPAHLRRGTARYGSRHHAVVRRQRQLREYWPRVTRQRDEWVRARLAHG